MNTNVNTDITRALDKTPLNASIDTNVTTSLDNSLAYDISDIKKPTDILAKEAEYKILQFARSYQGTK